MRTLHKECDCCVDKECTEEKEDPLKSLNCGLTESNCNNAKNQSNQDSDEECQLLFLLINLQASKNEYEYKEIVE